MIIFYTEYVERGRCTLFTDVSNTMCDDGLGLTEASLTTNCIFDHCKGNDCVDYTPTECKALPSDGENVLFN